MARFPAQVNIPLTGPREKSYTEAPIIIARSYRYFCSPPYLIPTLYFLLTIEVYINTMIKKRITESPIELKTEIRNKTKSSICPLF